MMLIGSVPIFLLWAYFRVSPVLALLFFFGMVVVVVVAIVAVGVLLLLLLLLLSLSLRQRQEFLQAKRERRQALKSHLF
jgi:uncharacterized membrane protein